MQVEGALVFLVFRPAYAQLDTKMGKPAGGGDSGINRTVELFCPIEIAVLSRSCFDNTGQLFGLYRLQRILFSQNTGVFINMSAERGGGNSHIAD